ncbi:MAG TPA: AraC family transcriptional regulator [Kiritimatiellia bacterium]|nr:AraC family transcriptional regulator [Kiritimatiellia bacterium]
MKELDPPYPGRRIVDRVPAGGVIEDWPSNTVRYISRSWRGPVHIQSEGVDFNLRYAAIHEHIRSGRYPKHQHPHSEFLLVLDGRGEFEIDGNSRARISGEPGDLLVMPPRQIHQSVWSLKKDDCWRLLVVDFDLAMDVARLPLEGGMQVDLAITPFYQWFFTQRGIHMKLAPEAWARAEPVARGILNILDNQTYGVGVELLSSALRLIMIFSRALREQNLADGRNAEPPLFSRQAALLKARNLMEHRGWFDPGCVGRIAREIGMSETHFIREFHAAYGISPKQYSQRVLMRRACALLKATDLPVKEIAERLGYEDPTIFSRAFTRSMGMSPAKYRRHAG